MHIVPGGNLGDGGAVDVLDDAAAAGGERGGVAGGGAGRCRVRGLPGAVEYLVEAQADGAGEAAAGDHLAQRGQGAQSGAGGQDDEDDGQGDGQARDVALADLCEDHQGVDGGSGERAEQDQGVFEEAEDAGEARRGVLH